MPHAELTGEAPGLAAAAASLEAHVSAGRLPAAVLEVGHAEAALGRVVCNAPVDAIFDLASLTKVLATGLAGTYLLGQGRLALDAPVRDGCAAWTTGDRAAVTVRDLFTHAAGLPPHLPLYLTARTRDDVVRSSAEAPLAYTPRRRSVYSDLGFIVLGDIFERLAEASLARLVEPLLGALSDDPPRFGVVPGRACLGTGWSAWRGRSLEGEVHDDNAAAMGGVAGHAGLFGSAPGVGDVARAMLAAYRGTTSLPFAPNWAVQAFARRSIVPGSSRALAWDTAVPTSSCGPHLSRRAIGHTGFTGTSIWIDPDLDLYVVLLTNRVAGTATLDDMAAIRREVHTAIGAARRAVPRG